MNKAPLLSAILLGSAALACIALQPDTDLHPEQNPLCAFLELATAALAWAGCIVLRKRCTVAAVALYIMGDLFCAQAFHTARRGEFSDLVPQSLSPLCDQGVNLLFLLGFFLFSLPRKLHIAAFVAAICVPLVFCVQMARDYAEARHIIVPAEWDLLGRMSLIPKDTRFDWRSDGSAFFGKSLTWGSDWQERIDTLRRENKLSEKCLPGHGVPLPPGEPLLPFPPRAANTEASHTETLALPQAGKSEAQFPLMGFWRQGADGMWHLARLESRRNATETTAADEVSLPVELLICTIPKITREDGVYAPSFHARVRIDNTYWDARTLLKYAPDDTDRTYDELQAREKERGKGFHYGLELLIFPGQRRPLPVQGHADGKLLSDALMM